MIKDIINTITLVLLYLIITFLFTQSLVFHIIIHLVIASLVTFVIFKKDTNPIKRGLILSLIIFATIAMAQFILGQVNTAQFSAGQSGFWNIARMLNNPLPYVLAFLICFNIPFIVKHFILKKKTVAVQPPATQKQNEQNNN